MAISRSDPDADVANSSFEQKARAAILRTADPRILPADALRIDRAMRTQDENERQAGGTAAGSVVAAMMRASQIGAVGPGGIDVRSYTGSLYSGNAQPIPGYQRPENFNDAADRILRGRFGPPPTSGRPMINVTPGAEGANSAPNTRNVSDAMAPSWGARGGVFGALAGTALDPAVRGLALSNEQAQIDDRRALAATRGRAALTADAKQAQDQTNRTALMTAMTPRVNLPSNESVEGAWKSGQVMPPLTPQTPNVVDAMRGYLGAGGVLNPQADAAFKAMGTAAPFQAHEETLPGGSRMIYNSPRSAIPDPMQARPARTPAAKGEPKAGVEEVKIGPQTYFYHHESKKYFDASGKPVAFPTAGGKGTPEQMLQDLNAANGGKGGGAAAKDQFEKGKVYKDGKGVRAEYLGDGKWKTF